MTKLPILFATLIATTAPALAGPDFATPTPHSGRVTASPGTREIAPSDDVTFHLDSAILHDTEQRQIITAASWLRDHPKHSIILEGYADASGPLVYNEDLATRRASTVRGQLIARGVPADRIVVIVYGEIGATGPVNSLDRRVVMHSTKDPIVDVVAVALNRGAVNAVWTKDGALFRETRRGLTKAVAIRD